MVKAKSGAANSVNKFDNDGTDSGLAEQPPHDEGQYVGADQNAKQQADATAPAVSPEVAEKINAMRTRFSATFSQVVISLMSTARYRHQSIADLEHLVTEPLMRNRIAIASAKPTDGLDQGQLVGLAYWAKVSEAVEDKIKEQIKNAVFPIRLKPEEWESGDRLWLLDVVAPNRQAATAVLANFRQVADKGNVALHPVVSAVVDPEVLKKLVVKGDVPTGGADQ